MREGSAGVKLTLRDGGWILVVTGVLIAALLVWAFSGIIAGHRPKGGGDLASYAFDLSTCLVPREELVPTGEPRDFLRALVVASTVPANTMPAFNRAHRKRYVVGDDRVVGVVINNEARAYPLLVLEAHEALEDTLGGIPIVVTYSPLCDAVAVYERTLDGAAMSFGISGIVRNANTLLYDKSDEPNAVPSLWQQLDGRAIAGPAAARGARLQPVPDICVTTFDDWCAAHPDSTVIKREEGNVRLYESISYERAHARPALEFPASPLPSGGPVALKEPVLVIDLGGERRAYAIEQARAAGTRAWKVQHGPATLTIHLPAHRGTARIESDARDLVVTPTFWFAACSTLGVRDAALP